MTPAKARYTVPRTRGSGYVSKGEIKYFTATNDFTVPASTDWTGTEADPAAEGALFTPDHGTAINQRIGEKVTVEKIKIHGLAFIPKAASSAAITASTIRLLLVQDMQTNASQCQGEQIMDNTVGTDARDMVNAFQSDKNFGRFRVLKEKIITLQNPQNDGTVAVRMGLERAFRMKYVFKKPLVVRFNRSNNATVADIVDNSFHLIVNATNIDGAPVVTYQCRTSFRDN